ncbi:PQQ-binding-like beta-propeller repeat protein [Embleya scabrispora]|uniref:outer membrane protein assembly factor BamB family protein n=1 Tax=Embleya scabrispora TaxID=159449 RepID=UPI0003A1F788|nr:PQQ-binding-like beta-propeller repeat protein [Embleya scabrispora]MYS83893.1 PQQ-binding-like beta-propeller repeat protein [Streptomyces sp. SID5474]
MTVRILAERYQLTTLLGRGGMGEVWAARDLTIDRRVAVKLLRTGADDGDTALFLREARTAGGVDHPGIVTVHDVGRDAADGTLYLVMEHVEGRDLARVLREDGPPPVPIAADRVAQAAVALHAAHRAGIVHRDVKPANLMLTPEGTIKVLDFGIARYAAATRESTRLIGTLGYMPPERVRGTSGDARGDLYSLGWVLHELLTGDKPFGTSEPVALMYAHLRTAPDPPSRLRSDVPAALDAVVLRMLAKKPADRPRDAAEVARLLRPFAEGTDTVVLDRGTRPQIGRRGVLVGGLGVVGAGVWLSLYNRGAGTGTGRGGPARPGKSATPSADASAKPLAGASTGAPRPIGWRFAAREAINTAPTIVADTAYITSDDHHVYAIDTATGTQRWSFEADGLLERPLVAGGVVHVIGHLDKLYTLDAATGVKRWEHPTGEVLGTPIATGGVVYVGGRDNGLVYAFDAGTGSKRWEFATNNVVNDPLATWKGVVVAAGWDGRLYGLDAQNGAKIWTFDPAGEGPWDPVVADGRVFCTGRTASGKPQLYAIHHLTGVPEWASDTTGIPWAQVAFADYTAYHAGVDADVPEVLRAFDTSTGKMSWEYALGSKTVTGLAPHNRMLYVGSAEGTIIALDARTGVERWSSTPGGPVRAPLAVSDGLVHAGSEDRNLYALDAGTGEVRWTRSTTGAIKTAPVVADRMVYAATADGALYAVDAKTGEGP